jgi:hypothetical protein
MTARRDRALRAASLAFACSAGLGTVVAIRDDLPGRPLGVGVPLSVPTGILVGWGAGVAAPWPMPVAALIAAARVGRDEGGAGPALVCTGLGLASIVGLLIEPNTYRPRSWTRATRVAIVLDSAASAVLAVAGIRSFGRIRSAQHAEQRQRSIEPERRV